LFNSHKTDLEKKSPKLKKAEELIHQHVDSHFAEKRNSQK